MRHENRNIIFKESFKKDQKNITFFVMKNSWKFVNARRRCYFMGIKTKHQFVDNVEEERIEFNGEIVTEEELLNKLQNK